MEVLHDAGMGIEAICGGQCACATCHCLVEPEWFGLPGAPGEDELDLVSCLNVFDAGPEWEKYRGAIKRSVSC